MRPETRPHLIACPQPTEKPARIDGGIHTGGRFSARGRRSERPPVLETEREELADLIGCRRQLVDEITVRKQQFEHL